MAIILDEEKFSVKYWNGKKYEGIVFKIKTPMSEINLTTTEAKKLQMFLNAVLTSK